MHTEQEPIQPAHGLEDSHQQLHKALLAGMGQKV